MTSAERPGDYNEVVSHFLNYTVKSYSCRSAQRPLRRVGIARPHVLTIPAEIAGSGDTPNSTGTFNLIPLDRRPMFTSDTPPCTTAAAVLDGILAIVLTRQDDEQRIRHYAETITREATRWASA